jgi:hypothetical protein
VSVAFTWADGEPADLSGLYLSVRVTEGEGGSVLATAGPTALSEEIDMDLFPIPYGEGRVVTVEVRDNPGTGSRPLYYGISEPFGLTAGQALEAVARVPITAAPDIATDGSGSPPVSVSGIVGDGVVGSTQITLNFRSASAVGAEVSNVAGFETGTFEVIPFESDVGAADADEVTTFSAAWDLDTGVDPCGVVDFCPRRVFVRFVDAEGYYSETTSVEVIADTRPPTVVQSTVGLSLDPAAENLLVRQQLSERIERVGVGTVVRASFTLNEVVVQNPVVRAVGLFNGGGFALELVAGNGAFFLYEGGLDPDARAPDDTYELQVEATDKAGTIETSVLQTPEGSPGVVVDTSAPNTPTAPVGAGRPLVYHRAPWGPDPDGAALSWFGLEGAAASVEPWSTVVVFDGPDPESAQRIGVATADGDGAFASVPLNRLDRARVYALVVDGAGNHQDTATLVRDVDWIAGFTGREAGSDQGNPHVFESRAWMLDNVLVQHDAIEAGEVHGIADDAPGGADEAFSAPQPSLAPTSVSEGWVRVTAAGAWRTGEPIAAPAPRFWGRASYDPIRGESWILGGRVDSFGSCDGEGNDICRALWTWGGGAWQRADPGDAFGDGALKARERHAQAYDFDRGELVVFGGKGAVGCTVPESAFCGDTWVYDGDSWRDATPPSGEVPMRRILHTMTYDSERRQVLMYGGVSESVNECNPGRQYCGNTWVWDGATWSTVQAYDDGARPDDRRGHVMAYDPILDKTILFGGHGAEVCDEDAGSELCSDTWQWTGTQWQEVGMGVSDPQPSGREDASLVYCPKEQRLMLFGGDAGEGNSCDGGDRYCDTLWSWEGTRWEKRALDSQSAELPAPVGRTAATLSVDQFGHLLLMGGRRTTNDEAGDCTAGDTALCTGMWWFRDTWVDLAQSQSTARPAARYDHVMAALPGQGTTVLFGGIDESQQGCGAGASYYCDDTWVWNGSGWQERVVDTKPGVREGARMHYDSVTEEAVMTGGKGKGGQCDGRAGKYCTAFWAWNGSTWTETGQSFDASNEEVPDPRLHHVVAYDEADAELLVAAGGAGSALSDAWTLTGEGWSSSELPGSSVRFGAAMAWSEAEDHAVLFGGEMQITADETCPPEALEQNVCEPGTDGCKDTCYFGDSWVWDGTSWAAGPSEGPFFRTRASLVAVPDRDALLLFGGQAPADCGDGSLWCNDLWEWSASQWRLLAVGDVFGHGRPAPRTALGFAYDSWRQEALLFGGEPSQGDTWVWSPGLAERPGQVARFSFADAQAPEGVTMRTLSVTWEAQGAGHDGEETVPGVSLLLWYEGQWRSTEELAEEFELPGVGLVDDLWETENAELVEALVTGSDKVFGLAVAPAATGRAPEPAWVASDYVRIQVGYRLP